MSLNLAAEAATAIRARLPEAPRVAIVLGSGLKDFAENLEQSIAIPYNDIPHYPQPTVEGHSGELAFGYAGSLPVLAARGRLLDHPGWQGRTVVDHFQVAVGPLRGLRWRGGLDICLCRWGRRWCGRRAAGAGEHRDGEQ